jgi:hypothetical protein
MIAGSAISRPQQGALTDAQCIGRLTLELDFKLPLLDLEHGCEPSRHIRGG